MRLIYYILSYTVHKGFPLLPSKERVYLGAQQKKAHPTRAMRMDLRNSHQLEQTDPDTQKGRYYIGKADLISAAMD
jgi:hypothetical protein